MFFLRKKFYQNLNRVVAKSMVAISLVVLLCSCSKETDITDDENTLFSGEHFVEIILDSKKFEFDFSKGGKIGEACDGRECIKMEIGKIDTPELYLMASLTYYKNISDFEYAKTGEYYIYESSHERAGYCNFDIEIYLVDKTESHEETHLKYGSKNIIKSINKIDNEKYELQGKFSCVFYNSSRDEIPVICNYNVITWGHNINIP